MIVGFALGDHSRWRLSNLVAVSFASPNRSALSGAWPGLWSECHFWLKKTWSSSSAWVKRGMSSWPACMRSPLVAFACCFLIRKNKQQVMILSLQVATLQNTVFHTVLHVHGWRWQKSLEARADARDHLLPVAGGETASKQVPIWNGC